MKKTIIALGLLIIFSCKKENTSLLQQQKQEQNIQETEGETSKITEESIIKFDEDTYDFKEIEKGEEVTHEFKFTNVGKKPLIISEVRPACGCTTPKYTKEPVYPGKKGSITVTFDSSNFEGAVFKTVAVAGNFKTKMIKFQAKINK